MPKGQHFPVGSGIDFIFEWGVLMLRLNHCLFALFCGLLLLTTSATAESVRSARAALDASETIGSVTLDFQLINPPCDAETGCFFNFTTVDGSAQAGTDYVAASGTVRWELGESNSQFVTISIIDNTIADGNRVFTVEYSNFNDVDPVETTTITITDDEFAACPFDPAISANDPDCPAACPFDSTIAENNPNCPNACPFDPAIAATDANCPAACPTDATIPVTDPTCQTATGTCPFDPTLAADDPNCPDACPFDPVIAATNPSCPEACASDASIPADDPNCAATTVPEVVQEFANTPGQSSTANVIGTVCPQGVADTAFQDDCNALVGAAFDNDANVGTALSQITPDDASIAADASQNSIGQQMGNVGSRLAALRSGVVRRGADISGLSLQIAGERLAGSQVQTLLNSLSGGGASSDESGFARLGFFVSGDLGFGDKDPTANEDGFDYDIRSITAGVDYRLSDAVILGAALGYSSSDTDVDANGGNLNADSYSLTLFGTFYQSDQFFIDGSLSFGRDSYDQERNIRYTLPGHADVNQTLFSDYDGDQFAATVNAGYEFRTGGFTLVPSGRLQYIDTDVDGFSENAVSNPAAAGAGWGVSIDNQSFQSFTLGLGGQVNYAISQSWGIFLPYASFEWIHEFEENNDFVTGSFIGDPTNESFSLPTDANDSNYFNLGVGFSAQFKRGAAAFLNYQQVLGYDDLDHYNISAGFRLEF